MRINGDINKSEGLVWKYLMEKEYNLIMGKFLSNKEGIPDFKVVKGDKEFWCEVKSMNDGLRAEQILWFNENNGLKIVALVKPENKEIYFFKVDVQQINFKNDSVINSKGEIIL